MYKRLTKRNNDGSVTYAEPIRSSYIAAIEEETWIKNMEIRSDK